MLREAITRVFCSTSGRDVEIIELYSVEKGMACPIAATLVEARCREQEFCGSAGDEGCPLNECSFIS